MRFYAGFALANFIIGTNIPIQSISNRYISPVFGASIRFLLAALLLFAIVALRRIPLPRGRALALSAIYGALTFGVGVGCFYLAVTMTGAAPVALLSATSPLFAALIAAALRMEKLTARRLFGIGIALVGSTWIYRNGLRIDLRPAPFIVTIIGAASIAVGFLVLKTAPRTHPLATNAVANLAAGLLLLVLALAGGYTQIHWAPLALAPMAWLVIVGTLSTTLLAWLILHWSPTRVSYQAVVSPPVAAAISPFLLHEAVHKELILGGLAILIGAWAVLGERSAPQPARATEPG